MLRMYFGYLLALGLTTAAVEVVVHTTRGDLMYFHGWSVVLPCCSLVLGGEIWLLAAVIPSERRRWNELLAGAGKPPWYELVVGLVTGAGIGVCCGALFGTDLDRGWLVVALSVFGPVPAVMWVYSLRPDPAQADYDDTPRPGPPE